MEVLLADEYGFCFGVERAVEMVEDALDEGVRPIRSLGPLIHNAQEMERLGEQGVSTIDAPEEADADTIAVIRAHGVTPQVQHDLEDRAAKVIDATCPFVTRVQHLAERAAQAGTRCRGRRQSGSSGDDRCRRLCAGQYLRRARRE